MTELYKFPEQAAFGRILPKNKIYEKAKPSAKIRQLFVDQIERITWSYKLAPKTINLPVTEEVDEIQVMTLELRQADVNYDLLRAIDKAILSPIIFILKFNGKLKYVATVKGYE